MPIGLKWLIVGRWQPQTIPVWSPGYLRFWSVKMLVRSNPLVLFAGTPLFVLYLRLLGARVAWSAQVGLRDDQLFGKEKWQAEMFYPLKRSAREHSALVPGGTIYDESKSPAGAAPAA